MVNAVEALAKAFDQTVMLETAEHSMDPAVKKALDEKLEAEIAVGEAEAAVESATEQVADLEGAVEFAKAMEPGVEKCKGKAKTHGDQWRQR